jgi:hypothetical protein
MRVGWRLLCGSLWFVACCTSLMAQQPDKPEKEDEEIKKAGPVDPYTGGDAGVMAAAGVVAYGPFPWADFHSTADVDKVLGEHRVLWLETKHFRIGSGLKSAPWPEDSDKKKALQEEIRRLRARLPKVPEKPKKLDPWLRLHLYAQRAERCYSDFLELIGKTDADFPGRGKQPREGAYLGQPDKFLLLLCQRKSDMARYMDRFCGRKEDSSMRYYHAKTHQMIACLSVEGLEGFDETALHGHMVYATMHNLMSGYNGFYYPLPLWFAEGLAHWYARKVPSDVVNAQIRDDEAVAEDRQSDWPVKVRRRAQHVGAFFPFEKMVAWEKWEELGYHAHSQSWSRVDYLLSVDKEKVGRMIRELKAQPVPRTWGPEQSAQIREATGRLLMELFGLDAAAFDQKWRDWVLKTYPKK